MSGEVRPSREIAQRRDAEGVQAQAELRNPFFLVVGLGNPGRQYRNNRHNVGFMLVDRLATRLNTAFSRVQFRALTADLRYEGRRLILAKPQTYMNDSGVAVGSLARFYKLTVENILVAHDDVDLPLGIIRIRPGGSSAGQKGIASIIERLGTQEFPRLRIGIGRPPGSKLAVAYVLQDFSRDESEIVQFILERAANATLSFVTDGLEKAMNQYNGRADGGDDVVDDVGT